MKNRPTASNIVSEWEDNVSFDADDPDFCGETSNVNHVLTNSVGVEDMNSTKIFIPAPPILDSISTNSFNFRGKLALIFKFNKLKTLHYKAVVQDISVS